VLGTDGIIEVPSAFVTGEPGSGNFFIRANGERREVEVPHVNAYSEQADQMYRAVIGDVNLPYGADDAINNMRVIDACLRSARERIRVSL
jgi:D-xylose 1-dehydrogenase (NADP+, D-xylono-1,5-lactone-forming)